jgi:predicted nucleotidyltransferase component of viral defense system
VVFKGGTSLFKLFGAIDRFSEDIDLSVSPSSLGHLRFVSSSSLALPAAVKR